MSYNGHTNMDTSDIRLVVLGQRNVGKSALTVRFLTKRFIGEYEKYPERRYTQRTTLNGQDVVTFEIRDITLKKFPRYSNSKLKLRYQGEWEPGTFLLHVEQSSLKDVKSISWGEGFAVTYDITDRSSFNSALQIISAIHEQKKTKDVVIALMGNKKDLEHFRSVPREEGNTAAHQLGCIFFELSASEELDSVCSAFSVILDRVKRRKHHWQPAVKKVNSLRTKKTNVRYLNVFSKLKHDKKRPLSFK